jgi:hypothetical protein
MLTSIEKVLPFCTWVTVLIDTTVVGVVVGVGVMVGVGVDLGVGVGSGPDVGVGVGVGVGVFPPEPPDGVAEGALV